MKKWCQHRLLPALLFCFSIEPSLAVDLERGRELHDENCIQCHASLYGGDGSSIYLRPDRRIDSLQALDNQIRKCKDSLGFAWPEDQIEDLIAYLNHAFYHFE